MGMYDVSCLLDGMSLGAAPHGRDNGLEAQPGDDCDV